LKVFLDGISPLRSLELKYQRLTLRKRVPDTDVRNGYWQAYITSKEQYCIISTKCSQGVMHVMRDAREHYLAKFTVCRVYFITFKATHAILI
jgi:hypothetical protein